MNSTMLDAAVELVWRGHDVVPLHTPTPGVRGGCSCMRAGCGRSAGKHPRTANGHLDATGDVEQVFSWWRSWPLANVGCRPSPGQLVVDIDPRHGGDVALHRWEQEHGALPRTRTARTGGGGEHRWFSIPQGLDVTAELVAGVDLKTRTGLIVMPPSLHVSGSRYSWTNPGDITDAPAHLLAAITRRPRPSNPRPATSHDGGPRQPDGRDGPRHRASRPRVPRPSPVRDGLPRHPRRTRPRTPRATALRVGRDSARQVDRTIESAARAVADERGAR